MSDASDALVTLYNDLQSVRRNYLKLRTEHRRKMEGIELDISEMELQIKNIIEPLVKQLDAGAK